MKKSFIFLVISLLLIINISFAQEAKKVVIEGRSYSLLELANLGALNFMGREGEYTYRLELKGSSLLPDTALISGFNHNILGELVGVDDAPAVTTNKDEFSITYEDINIEGVPPIQTGVDNINVKRLVDYFSKKADITIINDVTYDGSSIGGPSDYKIVFVDNANITLKGDFKGYGVLAINDRTPTGLSSRFVMEGRAVWYGLVIVFQNNTDIDTEITRCSLEGSGDEERGVGDFVLLALNEMTIGNNLKVLTGSLGVNSLSGRLSIGNNLDTHRDCSLMSYEITAGNNAFVGGDVRCDRISLGNNVTIGGDIYRNSLNYGTNFKLEGNDIHPYDFKGVSLPDFPDFSFGTVDISKGNNQTYTLLPGTYRDITFGNNCTLKLTGGVYNIRKLTMGNNGTIQYEGSTSQLRINQSLTMGNNPKINPKSGSGLDARNLIIYIAGTSGLTLGNNSHIECNLYMPSANLTVGNSANFKGSFIAKNIDAGNCAGTSLDNLSVFRGGVDGAKTMIIGSVILGGKQFFLPNGKGNNAILFSKEALRNVEDMMKNKGLIWEWKQVE
ncbi:MAG: hypothetical protein NC822_05835 [Candidatus Omnitrophica bacterium]|nr:hypothetical protein [Candidatus Omnitrophota bacterium]